MRPRGGIRRGGNYLFNSFGPFYIREPVRMKVYMIFLLGIVIGYALSWTVRVTLDLPSDGSSRWVPAAYKEGEHLNAHAAAARRSNPEPDTAQPRVSLPPPQGQEGDVFDKVLRGVEDEVSEEIIEEEEYEGEEADGGGGVNPHTTVTKVNQPSPDPTSHNRLQPVKTSSPYHVAVLIGDEHTLAMSYCLHTTWGGGDAVSLFSTIPIEPMHLPRGISVRHVTSHSDAWLLGLLAEVVPTLQDGVQWLVLVPGTVYVRLPQLQEVLQRMDPQEDVYLGFGHAHCSFWGGIILSRALFTKLYRELDSCAKKFLVTDGDVDGDSVLGQCALGFGAQCSNGGKEMSLFYTDVDTLTVGDQLFDAEGLTEHVFFPSLIYPKFIYRLFIHFSIVNLKQKEMQTAQLHKKINELLPFIPSRLRPPPVERPEENAAMSKSPIPYSKPKYIYDMMLWDYFNQSRIMIAGNEFPATGLFGTTRNEIKWALTHGLGNVKRSAKEPVTFVRLENGFRRANPSQGLEYVLDFVVKNQKGKELIKRTSFSLPFADQSLATSGRQGSSSAHVHFLTTISGVAGRLPDFLDMFHQKLLAKGEDVSLTIILFNGPDAEEVKILVENFRVAKSVSESQVRVVMTAGAFARGRGLAEGLKLFEDSDLVFVVDVDMIVDTAFPMRCRQNTIQGQQVYFPVFFKLYNPRFVQENTLERMTAVIKRHNGHWAHYSFGMLCIYAGDYRKTTGYSTEIRGWGEEDVELFKAVVAEELEVFRSPDPGLLHRWHRKICDGDKITHAEALYHCKRSRGENIADRIELANYMLNTLDKTEGLHEELTYLV